MKRFKWGSEFYLLMIRLTTENLIQQVMSNFYKVWSLLNDLRYNPFDGH